MKHAWEVTSEDAVEVDMSAQMEKENVEYEKTHRDSIKVSVVPEKRGIGVVVEKTATGLKACVVSSPAGWPVNRVVIKSHEGVVSASLELEIGGQVISVANELKNWKLLKEWLDAGVEIVECYEKWNGEKTISPWSSTPSYTYRFGHKH